MRIPVTCYNALAKNPKRERGRWAPSPAQGGHLQGDELARKIIDVLSDKQAEDILLLDIRNVASFADYFVIASAPTVRQTQAVLEAIDEAMREERVKAIGREGEADSGWVLLDYGDVIVHIFAPGERSYYDLEGLWANGVPVVRIQ